MIELSLEPPLLVFGGPYSNLHAFNALRKRAGALGIPPSRAICTGDVVAYCGEPEKTTQAVRDWGCHVIVGNCEELWHAACRVRLPNSAAAAPPAENPDLANI